MKAVLVVTQTHLNTMKALKVLVVLAVAITPFILTSGAAAEKNGRSYFWFENGEPKEACYCVQHSEANCEDCVAVP